MLNLYNHSVYSYKEAINKVEEIAEISKQDGNSSFVISDLNNMTSFAAAFDVQHKTGLKFIPGVEFFVQPLDKFNRLAIERDKAFIKKEYKLARTTDEMRLDFDKLLEQFDNTPSVKFNSVILLSKNETGMDNLIAINNNQKAMLDESDYYINRSDLKKYSDGLFALIGHENSELYFLIENELNEYLKDSIECYKATYGENLFIIISDQNTFEMNQKLIKISEEYKIKLIYAPLSKYPTKNEKTDYRIFYAIFADKLNKEVTKKDLHIHKDEDFEQFKETSQIPEDLLEKAYKNIEFIDSEVHEQEFPTAPPLHGGHDLLRKRCEEGLEIRFKNDPVMKEKARDRMNYELDVIKQKNFSQYFIKVMQITDLAKKNGILTGPGRGSGGGSMVTYLTGITQINPLKYGLLFERFINPERPSYPDIDLDFANVAKSENLNPRYKKKEVK